MGIKQDDRDLEKKVAEAGGLPTEGKVAGLITLVQEDRFRLEDDRGRGYLFILAWKSGTPIESLHHWNTEKIPVLVEWEESGPDLGAIATRIKEYEGDFERPEP
jgi:hypothetical protein